MKVKELIAILNRIPQDQPVFISFTSEYYMGTFVKIEEPQDIFQKEGCTLISFQKEKDIVKHMDASDTFMLKEASSNSKGATNAS